MIKIRKAKKEDIKEIDKIYSEGCIDEGKYQFHNITKKEMKKDLERKSSKRKRDFKEKLKKRKQYWLIAEINNKIIGFGQVWFKDKEVGKIQKIYIDRKFRRKGIGEKICKELIKWLKKNKIKHIEAGFYWKNKPSIEMHKKLGFRPISLIMRLK